MSAPLNKTGPVGPLPGGTPPRGSSVIASVETCRMSVPAAARRTTGSALSTPNDLGAAPGGKAHSSSDLSGCS
jgi:hypothetical protein